MSKKDSYWFKHDSTAGRGLRLRKIAHIYGHWGKGVYWDVIEVLREQSNYCFNSDDSSLHFLSDLIGCKDTQKFINWFNDCIKIDLFKVDNNMFFSEILCENMSVWEIKKHNGNQGGRPKKKPNRNQTNNLNETETITETKANRNHKIIEDNIIDNNSIINLLLSSEQWREAVMMNNGINAENLQKSLKDFVSHLISNNEVKTDKRDFVKHYTNWLRINVDKYKNKPRYINGAING